MPRKSRELTSLEAQIKHLEAANEKLLEEYCKNEEILHGLYTMYEHLDVSKVLSYMEKRGISARELMSILHNETETTYFREGA
jgi:hypothetical protein